MKKIYNFDHMSKQEPIADIDGQLKEFLVIRFHFYLFINLFIRLLFTRFLLVKNYLVPNAAIGFI